MLESSVVSVILWRSLAIFLLVGAVTGCIVSLMMIYRPALFERVNRVANLWISTRRLERSLEVGICLEQWFYRHHRPLGILVCVGAAYVFVYFGVLFDKVHALPHLAAHLSVGLHLKLLEGLLDAFVLVSLTGAAASLFVGLLLWQRPSLLRGLEGKTNRWVSTRRGTKCFDVSHNHVDAFVLRHDQRTGWLLLLGSLYLFFLVFPLLT